MKILVKCMTLVIGGFVVCLSLVYLININIMINEMDNACKNAVDACQKIMKSQRIDSYLSLELSDYPIHDDQSYKEYFISSFNNLVTNDELYEIDVYCSFDKGLIAAHIHNNYSSLIKDKEIVNIIEVSE